MRSIHELSDDELLELDPEQLAEMEGAAAGAGEEEAPAVETPEGGEDPASAPTGDEPAGDSGEDPGTGGEDPGEAPTGEAGGDEAVGEGEEEDAAAAAAAATAAAESLEDPGSEEGSEGEEAQEGAEENKGEEGKGGEEDPASDKTDYKAAYEKLMAPFKANGKEMRVENVDDAITLMQMGANYNKKMAALKPNLKIMKMLENQDLLDSDKLSYLIDLNRGDPAAVKKLVKESGIDPLELEGEGDPSKDYKPGTYTVDDREIELDSVLDKIQETPTYQKTVSVVSNKWDGPSKQAIADTPQLLEVINTHMSNGVYEVIANEVERERALGRLDGVSDLEAYRKVGDRLHSTGGFNHLNLGAAKPKSADTGTTERREVTPPKRDKADKPVRDGKRRAASPTKAEPQSGKGKEDFNPLAMSDEEFDKKFNSKLM